MLPHQSSKGCLQRIETSHHKGRSQSLEAKIKAWVLDWESRVIGDVVTSRHVTTFPQSYIWCHHHDIIGHHIDIREYVRTYLTTNPEQVGRDRFVWTSIVCALLDEHKHLPVCPGVLFGFQICRLDKCLAVLLLIGFYLDVGQDELVCQMIKQIIRCTGNIQFMFSYLPGLGVKLYTQLLWKPGEKMLNIMCKEYFSLLDINKFGFHMPRDIYEHHSVYLKYLLEHLRPFHEKKDQDDNKTNITLEKLLNMPILPGERFSLLEQAIHYNDDKMVRFLVERGASIQTKYWDVELKAFMTGERLIADLINSLMVTKYFFEATGSEVALARHMEKFSSKIDAYMPILMRSPLKPKLRKSSTSWGEENQDFVELNREIADDWGINQRPARPSLMTFCKVTIRNQILKADRQILPKAILTLPLPKPLMLYLGLFLD